MRLSGVGLLKQ